MVHDKVSRGADGKVVLTPMPKSFVMATTPEEAAEHQRRLLGQVSQVKPVSVPMGEI